MSLHLLTNAIILVMTEGLDLSEEDTKEAAEAILREQYAIFKVCRIDCNKNRGHCPAPKVSVVMGLFAVHRFRAYSDALKVVLEEKKDFNALHFIRYLEEGCRDEATIKLALSDVGKTEPVAQVMVSAYLAAIRYQDNKAGGFGMSLGDFKGCNN